MSRVFKRRRYPRSSLWSYLGAILACAAVTVGALPLRHILDLANIVMLFLLAVFLVALRLGRGPAVTTAVLSVVLFDYMFVPPHLALVPDDAQYLVTLAVMLAVALVTAQLTAGLREQTDTVAKRERQAQRSYRLARDLAGATSRWEVQNALDAFLGNSGYRAVLHLRDEDEETGALQRTADTELETLLQATLAQGESRDCAHCGQALVLPLRAPARISGAMVVTPAGEDSPPPVQEHALFESVASLIAIAVERLHYVDVAQETRLQAASERLRASLLSALSHDLRTPLTALVGLADSLAFNRNSSDPAMAETAAAIRDQARAMSHLFSNVLDMARLQSGAVALRKEWQLFDDVIGSSVRLLKLAQTAHPIRIRLAPDLPLVEFDAVMMERVIWNLLENAAKYSPAECAIEIGAFVEGEWACIAVRDYGPGFPAHRLDEVFGMFVRGNPESPQAGVGLGLAICRAIIEAHGGSIRAGNAPEGGACVTIRLPLGNPPAVEEEEWIREELRP